MKRVRRPGASSRPRGVTAEKRARQRLTTQYLVSRVLAESSTVSLAASEILQAICEHLGWQVGALWEVDPKERILRCSEVRSLPGVKVPRFEAATRERTFPPGAGLPGRVWESGKAAWVPDVPREESSRIRGPIASQEGLHAAFGFPIAVEGHVLGVIEFFSDEIRPPDPELLEMMTAVGNQIGLFLERRLTEQALRESEQRFAGFMQHLPGLAWIKDAEGRYVYANEAAQKVFRADTSRLYGHTDAEIFPPKTAERFRENDLRALRSRTGIQTIESLEHEDGIVHDSLVSKFCIPAADGRAALIGGMAIDITDRHRAERALRESEERLRLITNLTPTVIWTARPDGELTFASERWYEYTGSKPNEDIKGLPRRILHPEDYERTRARWAASLRDGTPYENEVRYRRWDGAYRWWISRAVPIRDEPGRIVAWFGSSTDIHDLKSAQEALTEADRRKDEFLATLAHELRNPLAPIRTALHLLQRRGGDAAGADVLEMMERQVRHMVHLVDDLMEVSRITRGKITLQRSPVELAAIVRSAIETNRPLIESAGHHVEIDLPRTPLVLDGDPVRLAQILSNLVNNAAKYTRPGGHIWLTAQRDGARAIVSVRDDGSGISPSLLPKVFDLFTQGDDSYARAQGGLGIGLTLAKTLAQMHGGTIEARSAGPDRGSEFLVRLPIAETTAAAVGSIPAEPREEGTAGVARHRILVVDDNRDAAESLGSFLKFLGADVRTAHNGAEALEVLRSHRPTVLLLDIGMPGMDGFEVARRARSLPEGRGVTLIAVTGWGQEEARRRSQEAGFDYHIVKPVQPDALEKLIAGLGAPGL